MIKAIGKFNGKDTLILGLSWKNLENFKKGPGDSYIHIMGAELGIGHDILIISDKTEQDMANMLRKSMAPGASIIVQPDVSKEKQ